MLIPQNATIIIGSGQQSSGVLRSITEHRGSYIVICADGGANYAMERNLTPDYLVGDFDSISPDTLSWLKSTTCKVIEYPANKDASDMELAIDLATTLEPRKIVLTSILGRRFDHSVANLLFLASKKFRTVDIAIVEDALRIAPLKEEGAEFQGTKGDTFSIIPLSSNVTGITITGSEWDLLEATIPIGSTWCISNRFRSSTVTAKLREGTAVFFHVLNETASIS